LVVNELGGVIPRQVEVLRELPGVGRYTASALASIAYGEPVAVVDGNVERVLSRLDGAPRADRAAWERAQELLDRRHPGDWNQAMMELGATVCTPKRPQCPLCPLRPWCRAPGAQTQHTTRDTMRDTTQDATRQPQPPRQRVRVTRALVQRANRVFLVQRPADAAKMPGMWELPECAAPIAEQTAAEKARQSLLVRHSITDTDYEVRVMRLGLKALAASDKKAGRWVNCNQTSEIPLTGLTRKILRKQGLQPASAGRQVSVRSNVP
jgi:A/G-specific adenine glycosylase